MISAVVTTIQKPTNSLLKLSAAAADQGVTLVVVGDAKTPDAVWPANVSYYSISSQRTMNFKLAQSLPENHYARKNLGYLAAIRAGSSALFETDDDNHPLPTWRLRSAYATVRRVDSGGWVNVYRYFTAANVWPRGLPLETVTRPAPDPEATFSTVLSPIQQCLANGSPDVDAVWRLILDTPISFDVEPSIGLGAGAWCPFNSQATWWFPQAYALLYLPSFVSFRMTDIWRSFVAQRCLWELGYNLVFHTADMFQERNEHNLLRDFRDEVPGYLQNDVIRRTLEELPLERGAGNIYDNLVRCYEALARIDVVMSQELKLVASWVDDVQRAILTSPRS